jgi:hypothetical protein
MSERVITFGSVETSDLDPQAEDFVPAVARNPPGLKKCPSDASMYSHISADSVDERIDNAVAVSEQGVADAPAVAVNEQGLIPGAAASSDGLATMSTAVRPQRDTEPILTEQGQPKKSDLLNNRPDVGNVGFFFWKLWRCCKKKSNGALDWSST